MNHFCKKVIRAFVRLPALGLIGLVRLYQKTLSPVLPVIFGPACGCRFYPTCSHYAAEALQVHGALRGTWLALLRLLKCTPLHPGGLDPVPPPRKLSCSRVTPSLPQRHNGSVCGNDAVPVTLVIRPHAAVPPFPTTLRTNG